MPNLILASGSPRRRKLLLELGLDFEVRPVETDETPKSGELATDLVLRLARDKALADPVPGSVILAADTMVVLDNQTLGKPLDPTDAADMLGRLAGRKHQVLTGVALLVVDHQELVSGVDRTEVEIEPLSPAMIDWYVSTGEPLDKAGSYAIQGLGALFVRAVFGNYSNVVGLPIPLTRDLFRQVDLDLRQFRQVSAPNRSDGSVRD